jgi:hypothetical protein
VVLHPSHCPATPSREASHGFADDDASNAWAFATGYVAAFAGFAAYVGGIWGYSEIVLSLAHGIISMTVVSSVPLSTATGVLAR